MDTLQIVHAADMHLGSPFRCESSEISARRRREQMSTLENLMLYIAEKKIPLVLMPGDIFDGMVTEELSREFFAKIRRMRDVRFVIAPGNHDYYTEGGVYDEHGDLPENLYVFRSPEITKFEFPEIQTDVYGFAFTSPTMYTPSFAGIELDPEKINLLCVHGALDDQLSPYCPLSSAEIAEKGFRYAALGHIHKGDHRLVGGTSFAYCGCLEGRDFGETGDKGVYRVEIPRDGEGPVTVHFRKLSKRNYEIVTADITSADSDGTAIKIIENVLSGFSLKSQDTFLRLVLTGSVAPGYTPDLTVIKNRLLRGFYYSELQDKTVPVFSADMLESDTTVRGSFYRALKPKLLSSDPGEREKAALAFRIGMKAINGEEIG